MSDGKNGFSNFEEFDFKPIGKAIKKAREARGITREQLSEVIDHAPLTYRQWRVTNKTRLAGNLIQY